MILADFKDFPRQGRVIGIDWGARRIGVAVSDESREFVFTRDVITIRNRESTVAKALADKPGIGEIIKLVKSEKIVGIIIGLPVHADGTDSATTKMVREFADELSGQTDLPVVFIEENLTSVAAAERSQESGIRNKNFSIDSESAKIILENAIAMIRRMG